MTLDRNYWNTRTRTYVTTKSRRQRLLFLELVLNRLREVFKEYKINSLLDLGCGNGFHFGLYNELGLRVKGIDFSEERVRVALKRIKQNGFNNIDISKGDFIQEDLPHGFDCIMLSYVLEHLEPAKVVDLIGRIEGLARYYIVVGYYSEPFAELFKKYLALCKKYSVAPMTFDPAKSFTTIPYDYPKLFKMNYDLYQFKGDNAMLVFKWRSPVERLSDFAREKCVQVA